MEKAREPMSYEKALKTLELRRGFSEQELKNSYRRLAHLHHPDNYTRAGQEVQAYHEEQMKVINEAHDFFDKLKKQNGNYDEVFNIVTYQKNILRKIDTYWQNTTVGDVDLIKKVKEIAKKYKNLVIFETAKKGIDQIFQDFLKDLKKCYEEFQKELFKKEFVFLSDIKEEINYDVKVEEFYKQMQSLIDKYSRKKLFEKRVKEECEKYKLYAIYDERIAELIKILQNNARIKAEGVSYLYIDVYIEQMHKEIESVFADVAFINGELVSLGEIVAGISDAKILEEYNHLVTNNKGSSISDIKRWIINLEKLIANYNIKHEFISRNRTILDEMFNSVQNSFNNAMAFYREASDFEAMKKALEFYTEFVSYYQGIVKQNVDLAAVSLLSHLSFRDFDADNNILNMVCKTCGALVDKIYIYMNESDFSRPKINVLGASEDGRRFYMLGINKNGNQTIDVVTYSDIDVLYMSLNEFVNSATYVGKHGFDETNNIYTILYINQDYMICLEEDGSIKICNQVPLRKYLNSGEAEPYKDKEFLKSEIARMMQEKLFKFEIQDGVNNNR